MAASLPQEKTTPEVTPRQIVEFSLPIPLQIPVRIHNYFLGKAYDYVMFQRDASRVFHAIKPVLSLLSTIGAPPLKMRCNPPGPTPSFQLDFSLGQDVIPDLNDYSAAVQPMFTLVEAGAVLGFDLSFHAPAVPFYGPETPLNWRDIVGDPSNNEDDTWIESFAHDEKGICLMQFAPDDPEADPENQLDGSFEGYIGFIERHADIYVRAIISWMRKRGEAVSDSHLYSIGASGIIVDPNLWLHKFRWAESPARRRTRISIIDSIGRLCWRGLTGPNFSSGTAPARNGLDGPLRIEEFLLQEVFGRNDLGDPESPFVTVQQRLERGVEQYNQDQSLLPDDLKADWALKSKSPLALLKRLAKILEDDFKRIGRLDDGLMEQEKPKDAQALGALSLLGFFDYLLQRGFITFENNRMIDPAGVAFEGIEVKSPQLQGLRLAIAEFATVWRPDDPAADETARDLAAKIKEELTVCRAALYLGGPPPDTQADVLKIEAMRGDFNFRTTMIDMTGQGSGTIQESIDKIDAVTHLIDGFNSRTERDHHEVYNVWVHMGSALTYIDRYFYAARWTKNPTTLMVHFFEGFSEGYTDTLGPGAESTTLSVFKKNLYYMPLGTLFTGVLLAGMIYGIGQYVKKNVTDLYAIVSDPAGFAQQVGNMIDMMINSETVIIFEELGKALGIQAAVEMQTLDSKSGPFTFIFEIGRIIGPLIFEEILSLLFEVYIIAPILSAISKALRRALRVPGGTDYFDELAAQLDIGDLVDPDMHPNYSGSAPRKLDDFPVNDLADSLPPNSGISDLDDLKMHLMGENPDGVIPPGTSTEFTPILANPNHIGDPSTLTTPGADWSPAKIELLRMEEWKLELEHLLSEDVITQAASALGEVLGDPL